ncbi:MAG: transporter substrate-binding protein [Microbacteriaceae bacterium]|nr:transporter substrate-binding protein [Microbacteriaceae bacterium]
MNRTLRTRSVAVLVLAGALGLTACASNSGTPAASSSATASTGWAKVVAEANQEGSVTFYSSAADPSNAALVTAFNKEYPNIQVQVTRLISGDLTSRFSSEKEAGAPSADVVQVADNVMLTAHPEWFTKMNTTLVPNIAKVPAAQTSKIVGPDYVSATIAPFTITINTNLVKKAPTTWKDLLNAPYAGKGSLADPRSASSFMATYAMLRAQYGDSFLKKLGTSGDSFYTASATQAPLVAAGSTGYFAPSAGDNSAALRSQGAPLKAVIVTPILALTQNIGINSKAQHPAAARVLANFILSHDGQAAICSPDIRTIMYSDIANCPVADSKTTIVDYAKGTAEASQIVSLLGLH